MGDNVEGFEDPRNTEIKRLKRLWTDALYTIEAYYNMLGPKGQEVADMWKKKNVQRMHFSWGPDANKMTGEERAEFILQSEHLLRREVLPGELD